MSEQQEVVAPAQDAPVVEPTAPQGNTAPANGDTAPSSPPEWFMADKYKSIEEQARAQYDMQKMIGENWGAPKENYKLEGIEGINPDDPIIKNLLPSLKEIGLSQDGFANLVKSYQKAQVESVKELEASLKETLTKQDAETIKAVDSWLNDSFSPEDAADMRAWITSERDFHLLHKLQSMIPSKTNVPSTMNANAVQFETRNQVVDDRIKYNREVKAGLRVPDKNYENQLSVRLRDAITREQRAKK